MKALVMGGTTFVSQSTAMFLIEKGYSVDIFTRGRNEVTYEGVNKHLIGDRQSLDSLKEVLTTSYDFVFDVTAYSKEDVELLTSVLDKDALKRYVFVSTCSVYMTPKAGVKTDEEYVRGNDPHFGGDYGYNKYLAEEFLFKSDIPFSIVRPVYIYGEYNNIYRDAYLFDSIERGLVKVPKDAGKAQFVNVWDLAKTMESLCTSDVAIGQAYNLCDDDGLLWSEWAEAGKAISDKTLEVEVYLDERLEEAFEAKEIIFPFGIGELLFSNEKLKKHGLYAPDTPFVEGLKKAYEWYKTVDKEYVNRRRFPLV